MVISDSFTGVANGANFKPTTRRGQSETTEFNISISGTFVATIELQRSLDDGVTFALVKSYSAPIEELGREPETKPVYRFACTAFTSGQADTRLGVD